MTHERYEVPASLDGPAIRFHGHREHPVPPHVWQAIKDAAQRVLDNYTRVGTPCGHAPAHAGANHCAVMICPHVLPPGTYEVTQDEFAAITVSTTLRRKREYHVKTHDQDVPLLSGAHEGGVLSGSSATRVATVDTGELDNFSPGQRHLMMLHPELDIACPWCKAPRGLMCISGDRPYMRVHTARKKTWHSTSETRVTN